MARLFSNPIALVCLVVAALLLLGSVNRVSAITDSFFVANIQDADNAEDFGQDAAANIDTELVINAQLFGEIEAEYVALESVAEETELPLVLKGVFAGSQPSNNAALIELENGKTNLVRVDTEIMEGAVLRAVYNDKVVISYRGRNESLAFPTVSMAGIDDSIPQKPRPRPSSRPPAPKTSAVSRPSNRPQNRLPGPASKDRATVDDQGEVEAPDFSGDDQPPATEYVPPGMSKRDEIRARLEKLRQGR